MESYGWLTFAVLLFTTPVLLFAEGETFDRALSVRGQQVDLSVMTGAGHVRVQSGPPGKFLSTAESAET